MNLAFGSKVMGRQMTQSNRILNSVIEQSFFDSVRNQLLGYRDRCEEFPDELWEDLAVIKADFVNLNDQVGAKAVWCLETIGHIQDEFISAFWKIKAERYQEAWFPLADCENGIAILRRHFFECEGQFGIDHVRVHVQQLQDLYHLKWGYSPGLLIEEKHCSICGIKRQLRSDCGHIVHEVYDGKLCVNKVDKAKIFEVSLVPNPAQKHSVVWPVGQTLPQFRLLKYLADQLLSPWDIWMYHKETRKSHHPAFKDITPPDLCPCGSGSTYEHCCINKSEIPEYPHFQFTFGGNTALESVVH